MPETHDFKEEVEKKISDLNISDNFKDVIYRLCVESFEMGVKAKTTRDKKIREEDIEAMHEEELF